MKTKLFDHYIQMERRIIAMQIMMKSGTSASHLIASNWNIQQKIRIISNITRSLKLSKVLEGLINFDYLESLDESRDRK